MNLGQHNGNGTSYILKSRSVVAKKYFESVFFKIALAHCQSFRIVQNTERMDKQNVKWISDMEEVNPENAGPTFLKNLDKIMQNIPSEY